MRYLNCEFKGVHSYNIHQPSRIETTRSGIESTTTAASAEVILVSLLYVSFILYRQITSDRIISLLTLKKDRTPTFIFNRSERRLTYRHLQKISRRQADDQRQCSNMDITDPVKQIVSQSYPRRDLSRPKTLS